MTLALYDRVQEVTTTAGTGPVTLLGPVAGFQSFAAVGDNNTCYYTIVDGTAWEVGLGTYSTTGPSLARTTILSNSDNTTTPITLSSSANTKSVFITYPAEKSINYDADGVATIGSPIGYSDTGVIASFASDVDGYNQVVLQNLSNATDASCNFNVSNNVGTPGFNYAEFGINSSTYVGDGSFSVAGAAYVASASTDLTIGTYDNYPIHFVTNDSTTDSVTIHSGGGLSLNGGDDPGLGNIGANNAMLGFQTITNSGGNTTLTATSPYFTRFTGSTTQTVILPDATTLPNGAIFLLENSSNSDVIIEDATTNPFEYILSGGMHYVVLMDNSSTAGLWGRYSLAPSEVEWGTNLLALGPTVITGGTWNGGTIPTGYGGTGLTGFSAANNAIYSTGASTLTAGTLPVLAGGTGSTTASGARSNLSAAASGANSDITSLSGLTTPLSVGQGGTGLSTLTANRIPYGNGTSALQSSVNFTYNGSSLLVGDLGGLGGATNPVIASVGTADNYVQSYIYNTSTGGSASADFVAYPHNGSDASGWIDIGITSIDFDEATFSITGPNEAYLFGSSPSAAGTAVTGNLVYATDGYGSANYHQWYIGGFNQSKSAWKMQLTPTGLQLADALGTAYGGTGNTTGQAASVANALTAGTGISFSSGTTYDGSAAITINNSGVVTYPDAGIAVSTGSAWGTSKASPTGDIVGTTDSQSLTNKTIGMSGALDCNNNVIQEIKTATFNSQTTIATTSGAITIDWTTAQNQKQTEPTGTITYTFTNPPGPCHLQLLIDSDGSSTAQTFVWPGNVAWMGVTWTATANKKAVINFWFDGTSYIAVGTNQA